MSWSVQRGVVSNFLAASVTPALPADVALNDILYLVIVSDSDHTVSSGLTDWTERIHNTAAADGFAVWSKVAGSSEVAPTVGFAATEAAVAVIFRVRGADLADTDHSTVGWSNIGASSTTTVSIDPPDAGSLKIAILHDDPAGAPSTTWAAGVTALVSGTDGTRSDNAHLAIGYKEEDTAGALTFTTTESLATLIISLKPAAGGPTPINIGPVALTLTPSVSRVVNRQTSLALSFAVSARRVVDRQLALAFTLTPTVALLKSFVVNISAALTLNPSVSRVVNRNSMSPLTMTASVSRQISRLVSAPLTLTPTVSRQISRNVEAALVLTASVSRVVQRSITAPLTFVVDAVKEFVPGGGAIFPINITVPITLVPSVSIIKVIGGGGRRLARVVLTRFGFYG